MKVRFEEIDLGYDRAMKRGPFKIAFCYSKRGNFRVIGAGDKVVAYINKYLSPCHFREISYPHNQFNVSRWRVTGNRYFISKVKRPNKYGKEVVIGFALYRKSRFTGDSELVRYLRKLPNRFIRELEGRSSFIRGGN